MRRHQRSPYFCRLLILWLLVGSNVLLIRCAILLFVKGIKISEGLPSRASCDDAVRHAVLYDDNGCVVICISFGLQCPVKDCVTLLLIFDELIAYL